jgi:hypothetical protein
VIALRSLRMKPAVCYTRQPERVNESMPAQSRQPYTACWIEPLRGKLRLRWRVLTADGTRKISFSTGLDNTPENWTFLEPIRDLVGEVVDQGKDPGQVLALFFNGAGTESSLLEAPTPTRGPTVRRFAEESFLPYNQPPCVRKAQARDYQRHLGIVCSVLGDLSISNLQPTDIRGLQAELLDRKLSTKYVKNIISGSVRAMIQQALDDRVIAQDPFPRKLKWSRWQVPPADPFTDEERARIEGWFEGKQFVLRPGRFGTKVRKMHPSYAACVHVLFWTGLRPSEVSGLQW